MTFPIVLVLALLPAPRHFAGTFLLEGKGQKVEGELRVTLTPEGGPAHFALEVVATHKGRDYFLPAAAVGSPLFLKGAPVTLGTQTFAWTGKLNGKTFEGLALSKDYAGSFHLRELKE